MTEQTLGIVKPDAVERNLVGEILAMIEGSGLKIKALKMLRLTRSEAEGFYAVHRKRPFFASLTEYMSSGPAVVMVLEGENAVSSYRALMGATNPDQAAEGTIRKKYALDIEKNAVHGSDSVENAAIEISYFFNKLELVG